MAIGWEQWERAVTSGHIKYLYKIQFVGREHTTVVPYTTGRESAIFEGVEYRPHPCIHEDIKHDEVGAETSIKVPAAKLWIETCLKHNPKVTLEIFRWREELGSAQSMFFGNLVETTFADTDIVMEFGTPLGAANVQLITYYTQRYCNHDMYGQYCGLNFNALRQKWSVYNVIDNRRIDINTTLDEIYWQNALFFYTVKLTDGIHEFLIEESNMVRGFDQTEIITKYPISQYLDTAEDIILAPNCLLDLSRCKNMLSNLTRACAWPDMPRANYTMLDVTAIGKGGGGNIGRPR